ncbi:DUF222 domain-containing protein [Mycobacterium barrassiae]|uniref:HNH endonuclease signature motif containing protein n=1 Tax=Mycobacterium barrassiae TaxID=319709 RepID=UPI002265BEED|nr:HNH endonuclease signature motif containing protein [Mycobacterium barrassiae]MCV7298386.1 DUF222 domain-containing protein [Mycobacterium barrassiae]
MYVRIMLATPVQVALTALRDAHDTLAGCDLDSLTHRELLGVLDELETLTCQLPTQWHRALARLQTETTPKELGAKSWKEVLAIRWRITTSDAGRRLSAAAELGPRQALTGQPLAPVLPATAAAQAAGRINTEHVDKIRDAMGHLPTFVDTLTREQIEAHLVATATGVGPTELKKVADKLLFLLDQDGPEPDDKERARKRGLQIGPQHRDGTVSFQGTFTPEGWAIYEPILAKWSAPGMCNPDDDQPCLTATPTQDQIERDQRTLAQRRHDALLALGRHVLSSGDLGQHNGLPTSIIIRTTLQDLESRAGVGTTGGGTTLPITDVIRLAGRSHQWLAVFDGATGQALDLFRAKRSATAAQRIMLIGRDGGCTKPSCPIPAYGTQVHHARQDWADGGNTNVNDLALACGPDNRLVDKHGGWTTTINDHGDVEWIPPPDLDTGQTRINYYHRPELLLRPPENGDENPERGP